MYLDGLDELDQKIIRLLIENARISYSDIGEETGISRVAGQQLLIRKKSVGLYHAILKLKQNRSTWRR